MLRSADGLCGYELTGLDGSAGKVDDLYFDDSSWRIRYLVANMGGWLSGKRVLLSPLAITGVPKEEGEIQLAVTTDQIRSSPDVDTAQPLSRQQERDLLQHYGWRSAGPTQAAEVGTGAAANQTGRGQAVAIEDYDRSGNNLRSIKEVIGYQISTADGTLGHVERLHRRRRQLDNPLSGHRQFGPRRIHRPAALRPLEWWSAFLFAIGGAVLIVAPFSLRGRRSVSY